MGKPNVVQIIELIDSIDSFRVDHHDVKNPTRPFTSKFGDGDSLNIYYQNKVIEFKKLLYKQLIIKGDSNLLSMLIEVARKKYHQHHEIKREYNKIPISEVEDTFKHEYQKEEHYFGRSIVGVQSNAFLKIATLLEETLKYYEYTSVEDFKKLLSELEENDDNHCERIQPINKVTFNLSKTDSIMFIYMLEKCNLIKFESTSHRNSFIENNFNYSELRNINSENKELQMKGINSDFANIKSNDKESLKRFNKNLESLKDKLQIIMDFKLES
ncbi:MAG: hypothetical protein RIQ59_835 [Bacteroidota bacterium]|jgi:hypothetical protein